MAPEVASVRPLGRWLRAAGYDTVFAHGDLPDRILAARCDTEERIAYQGLASRRHCQRYCVCPASSRRRTR